MIFHDHIDEIVDSGCEIESSESGDTGNARGKHTFIISHQDFTIEHLIISQDIIDHLFVDVFGR
jgi:hypothetical protein